MVRPSIGCTSRCRLRPPPPVVARREGVKLARSLIVIQTAVRPRTTAVVNGKAQTPVGTDTDKYRRRETVCHCSSGERARDLFKPVAGWAAPADKGMSKAVNRIPGVWLALCRPYGGPRCANRALAAPFMP